MTIVGGVLNTDEKGKINLPAERAFKIDSTVLENNVEISLVNSQRVRDEER